MDVGRIYLDESGAGRLYIPKAIVEAAGLNHKQQMKIQVGVDELTIKALEKTR